MPMFTLAAGSIPYSMIQTAIVNRVAIAIRSFIPASGPPPWIRPVSNDKYEITATEPWFAYIRTYGPSPVNAKTGQTLSQQGAGRLTTNIGRRVRIYLYSREGMDTVGGDEVSLGGEDNTQTVITPPSWPGHYILEDLILNAIRNWLPTYTNPITMVTIPLTLGVIDWVNSEDGPPIRPPENEVGLLRSHLDFWLQYIGAFDISDPAQVSLPVPISNPT